MTSPALSGAEDLILLAQSGDVVVVVVENSRELAKLADLAADSEIRVSSDPFAAFKRTKKIAHQLKASTAENRNAVLKAVGLDFECAWRYPFEFSAGQLQRLSLARAITLSPGLIVCEDATRELDALSSARFLKILRSLPMGALFLCNSPEDLPADESSCYQLSNGHLTELLINANALADSAPVLA